ncbi:MAG: Scaffold-type E3 ligase [Phylliscum demangeonii]|nr:MAG: Scaffold-type E3 ligase [Phylliscum demangeonii]
MPSSYSAQQRAKILQFAAVTGASERTAIKYLKSSGWQTEPAINAYLELKKGVVFGSGSSTGLETLNVLFTSYRDPREGHQPPQPQDALGAKGTMKYLEDLKIELEDVAVILVHMVVDADLLGELTRSAFVLGWKAVSAETIPAQQRAIGKMRSELATNPDLFRRVYGHGFLIARETNQKKFIELDVAAEHWRILFRSATGGIAWHTASTPWLDWYLDFHERVVRRPVSRDLWDMTYAFFRRSLEEGDSLDWYDDKGAWPALLDEFVAYVRTRRDQGDGGADISTRIEPVTGEELATSTTAAGGGGGGGGGSE